MVAKLNEHHHPLYFLLTVFKCKNPEDRGDATMECGGKTNGTRPLSSIKTHIGALGALCGYPDSRVDYNNNEKSTQGLAINRSEECQLTKCGRHCKGYSYEEAVRMVTITICLVWMICGIMGCPMLIVNVSILDFPNILYIV